MRHLSAVVLMVVSLCAAADCQSAVPASSAEPALVTSVSAASILREGLSLPPSSRVAQGDWVLYRARVTNVGGGAAYNVSLVDALPDGFAYVAGTTTANWPSAASAADPAGGPGPDLWFDLHATLPAGGTLTLNFESLVGPYVDEIGPYVNIVTAIGADGDGKPIPANNAESVPDDTDDDDASDTALLPARPALVTTKSVTAIVREGTAISTAGPIESGDVVTYRLTVENVGRGTAYNVGLEDELPTSFSYVDGSTTATWPAGSTAMNPAGDLGPSLVWPLSAVLGFGDTLSLEFDALVGSVLQGSVYVNAMTASSNDADGAPTPPDRSDEVPGDTDKDDASVASLSAIIPALSVNKEITDVQRDGVSLGPIPAAVPGDVVTYQFTIRNVGNGTAYNVDFHDTLPPGLEYETAAPHGAGSFVVSAPSATGTFFVPDGGSVFTTSIDATIDGGARLVATYAARITDEAKNGTSLENVAEAEGFNGAGVEIPDANPMVDDTLDADVEDSDADDTGIAVIRVGMPALAVDMKMLAIERRGVSIGAAGPVEPGDMIVYQVTIRNVGTDVAYNVGFADLLPAGLEVDAALGAGAFTVDLPAAGPTDVSLANGSTGIVDAALGARIDCGGRLTATYRAWVTSDVSQGDTLVNEVRCYGWDVAGMPIPPVNEAVGDTFSDVGTEGISVVEPALVTELAVASVTRGGVSVDPAGAIRPGDFITYRVRVLNAGRGTAYTVALSDSLSLGLVYDGPSLATWPGGTSAADPTGGTGPTLTWNLAVALSGGEELSVSFNVRVTDEATQSVSLLNVTRATGVDGAGMPIWPGALVAGAASVRLAVASEVLEPGLVPALATDQSVARIVRGGETTFGPFVEPGDHVLFEFVVRNVGTGTAYGVTVTGYLPPEVKAVRGSTSTRWPFKASFDDPSGIPGPELRWDLFATLRAGAAISLTFEVVVAEDVVAGQPLVGRMEVRGQDASGTAIPLDQSATVRADIDSDDAADLVVTARSPLLPRNEGAVKVSTPQAESIGDGVRFQTDIAFYASAELASLARWVADAGVSGTPLPACLRTVAAEAQRASFENLIEVEVGTGMGVPLWAGPRFRDAVDPEAALEERLSECARAVGLDPVQRPRNERWTVLEYAAGDPRFAARDGAASLGPAGDWKACDPRITPSAVGMSLLTQVLSAQRLLESSLPQDRYLGCAIVEAMRNKVATLAELRAVPGSSNGLLAHAYTATWSNRHVAYTVVEPRVDLYDQLALAWGLAAFVGFAKDVSPLWSDVLGSLTSDTRSARKELGRILDGMSRSLRGSDGVLRESTADSGGTSVRTMTLGLLLAALDDVSRVTGPLVAVERLATHAAIQLSGQVGLDGRVGSGASSGNPADACAAVRGLLAASRILNVGAYQTTAIRVLEALDRDFWNGTIGAYLDGAGGNGAWVCLTPLDLGLVVGALREVAPVLPSADAERILARLSSHVRAIVDAAALHLASALPQDGVEMLLGDETSSVGPVRISGAPLGWAFVFRDRLCFP